MAQTFPSSARISTRSGQRNHADAFGLCLGDLLCPRRHFVLYPAVDNGDFLCAEPNCSPGTVHGCGTTAHHHQTARDGAVAVEAHPAQKRQAALHLWKRLARNVQQLGFLGADGDIDGIVVGAELLHGQIHSDAHASVDMDARLFNGADLLGQYIVGQPVFGDPQ